jgi:hypothetical protein
MARERHPCAVLERDRHFVVRIVVQSFDYPWYRVNSAAHDRVVDLCVGGHYPTRCFTQRASHPKE